MVLFIIVRNIQAIWTGVKTLSILAPQALLTSIWAISCDSSDLYNFFLFRSIRMISFWQGNDILSNIRQDEYEEVIQMLENAILATDLALYFKYAFIFGVICLKSTPLFEFLFLSAKFFFVSWKYWPCRVQIIGELEVFVVLFTLYSALFGFCEHIESNILQLLEIF